MQFTLIFGAKCVARNFVKFILDTITGAGNKKDMGVVNKTIDDGRGNDRIGKEAAPIIEIKIAG